MNKKIIFIITSLMCVFVNLYAQVSLNPNDDFYKEAKNWETKGIVSWLPQIRPYSINTVKKILAEVKENGDESDVQLAEFYEAKFFSKCWNAGITIGDNLKLSDSGDKVKNLFSVEPEVYGDVLIHNLVGLGYKVGVIAQNSSTSEQDVLPLFYTSQNDTHDDPFTFGSAVANIDMGANLTVGKENIYGMFGLNRVAYGPFTDDSILLSGNQFHSGNLSFVYESSKWGYTQIFSSISRSTKNSSSSTLDFTPEKFMAFHSIRFMPVKQFAVTYFESSVYTNRFDPSYFLPVPYMVIQGMYGASDNTISGLTFDVRPVDRLGISLCALIDDINLNGFAKGEFDTRLKLALQGGINYVPSVSFIDSLSLDYTLVTPYTYSHCDPQMKFENYDEIKTYYNKDNYTNRLTNLGTKLPPNSDRIQFKGTFRPVERLRLDFSTTFVRHANIAESFTDEEAQKYIEANKAVESSGYYFATDGSIWTSSLTSPSSDKNAFMSQEHKMYLLQIALNAEYELQRMKCGSLVFNVGYMFEFIYNKGVDENIYTANSANPQDAKKLWVSNLHNVYNNYFSASVKYYY